jgi:hypothetical protein
VHTSAASQSARGHDLLRARIGADVRTPAHLSTTARHTPVRRGGPTVGTPPPASMTTGGPRTYTHVLVDERELDYAALLA